MSNSLQNKIQLKFTTGPIIVKTQAVPQSMKSEKVSLYIYTLHEGDYVMIDVHIVQQDGKLLLKDDWGLYQPIELTPDNFETSINQILEDNELPFSTLQN